jgi:hypothetical protein
VILSIAFDVLKIGCTDKVLGGFYTVLCQLSLTVLIKVNKY